MKKTSIHWMLVIVFATILMGSCKKDDKKDDSQTKTTLLSTTTWKYKSSGIDINNDNVVDAPDIYSATCQQDNILTFKSDGSGTLDEGPTKCDSGHPQSRPFTWKLTDSDTKLEYDGQKLTILSLTSSELKGYYDYEASGVKFRIIIVLQH